MSEISALGETKQTQSGSWGEVRKRGLWVSSGPGGWRKGELVGVTDAGSQGHCMARAQLDRCPGGTRSGGELGMSVWAPLSHSTCPALPEAAWARRHRGTRGLAQGSSQRTLFAPPPPGLQRQGLASESPKKLCDPGPKSLAAPVSHHQVRPVLDTSTRPGSPVPWG